MLDIELDETQTQIVESVRRVVPALAAGSHSVESGTDIGELADLGIFLLGIGEDQGGVGFTVLEEVLAYRELGRTCSDPALLAQTISAHIARCSEDPHMVERFGHGSEQVAPAPRVSAESYYAVNAVPDGWLLSLNSDCLRLHRCSEVTQRAAVTATNDRLSLERVVLPSTPSDGLEVSDADLRARAILLASAMLVGVSEGARDMAVEYSKVRKQFGDFIGAFQAIKHKCADMAVRSEAAWCQTVQAAFDLHEGSMDTERSISSAANLAARAAKRNSEENIQVHGGIGFTDECGAHLLLKQSLAVEQIWLVPLTGAASEKLNP